jgi:hypothetical protein
LTTETARDVQYVLCLNNDGYPVSLEEGKIYEMLPGGKPERDLIRVIDESGEDYLYPRERFAPVKQFPPAPPPSRQLASEVAQSDVEREARGFMEENVPLLTGGSGTALGRVFVQGARIATALSEESVVASNRAASVTRALAEAIRNPATPALRIDELEKERASASELSEHRSKVFEEFTAFLDRVNAARQQREGDTGSE